MYGRFQVDNFFVTTMAEDQTLEPGVDGILEVRDLPNVEDGKIFYVVFRVDNVDTRFSLPVYIDGERLKYKGYDVKQERELNKNDTVSMNDLAGNFNYIFDNVDDMGSVIKKGGLDILVYGGYVTKGGDNIRVSDTNLTLSDNATQYIVLDFNDGAIKSVATVDSMSQYCFAEITTLGGEIATLIRKKAFASRDSFSSDYFQKNSTTGAIEIKNNSIKKTNMDLSEITTDDIPEGQNNKYFPGGDNYQLKTNMKTNLENPNNTTYPTTQAVATAIESASGGMNAAVYDPNGKEDDAFDMDNMTIGNTNIYIIKKATAPSNPVKGMVWYDTTNDKLKAYNGSEWEEIGTGSGDGDMSKSVYDPNNVEGDAFDMDNMANGTNNEYILKAATAPANPIAGMARYDSTNNILKTYDGTNWIAAGDVNYSDFIWQDSSSGTIDINYLNTKTTSLSNITVNCGAGVKNGLAYMLRVTAQTNDVTLVLGTGVYNYAGVSLIVPAGNTKMFVLVATSDNQLEFQGNEGGYTGNKIFTTISEIQAGGTPVVIPHGLGETPKTIACNGFINFGPDDQGLNTVSRVLITWTVNGGIDFLGTLMHFSDGTIPGYGSNLDTLPLTITANETNITLSCTYYSKIQITAYL